MWSWFTSQIWPNIVADALYGTPAFLASHLLLRKHITKTAQQQPENQKEPIH